MEMQTAATRAMIAAAGAQASRSRVRAAADSVRSQGSRRRALLLLSRP